MPLSVSLQMTSPVCGDGASARFDAPFGNRPSRSAAARARNSATRGPGPRASVSTCWSTKTRDGSCRSATGVVSVAARPWCATTASPLASTTARTSRSTTRSQVAMRSASIRPARVSTPTR